MPDWFKRDIIKPATEFERDAVRHAQRVLRCPETGAMDESFIARLRGVQMVFGLPPTGVLDLATAEQIERIVNQHAV
jgi:hypothetical protein